MKQASKSSAKPKAKKQTKSTPKKSWLTGKVPYLVFAGVVLLFASIAGFSVFRSKAANYVVSAIEAESFATIPADASIVSDPNASNGKYVTLTKTTPIKTSVTLPNKTDSLGVVVKGQSVSMRPALLLP